MSHYKPYPAYLDSGVKWIGHVPEHWEIARIKRHASIRTERRSDVPANATYVGLEDVEAESGQYKPTSGNSRQTEDSTVGIFYEQDVLYGKLRPYLRKAIVAEMDGACSTEFLVLKTGNTLPRWLQQWLLTPDVTQQIEAGCEGAKMPRADWEHVGSIEMPTPSHEEQIQVISAVDRETARIDALITKKTRFIELLKEKRQALITHAVTKGLDPNVKMRDSGIDWIGEVPEQWNVVQVRHVATLGSGHTPSRSRPDWWEDCYIPWFTLADIWQVRREGRRFVTETEEKVSDLGVANSSAVVHPAGSVMLSRTASVGFPAIMGCDMATSQDFAVWRCGSRVVNEYLYLVLLGMKQELSRLMIGSTHKTIYMPDIEAFRMPLPSEEQQKLIVQYVGDELQRFDTLVAKTQRSIDLLRERRAAFITAAVTGQIDLRESA